MTIPKWIDELADMEDKELLQDLYDLMESPIEVPVAPEVPADYVWTPPEITKTPAGPTGPSANDWDILNRFENKLIDFKRDQLLGKDTMYQAIESGEVDATDVRAGSMPEETPVDMGFQQEMTTPNWLQRNVLRQKPVPTGQRPDFSMFSDDQLDILEETMDAVETMPIDEANAKNIPDEELGDFLRDEWGIKPELFEGEVAGLTPGDRPQPFEEVDELDVEPYAAEVPYGTTEVDEFAAHPAEADLGFNEPLLPNEPPLPTLPEGAEGGADIAETWEALERNVDYINSTEPPESVQRIMDATHYQEGGGAVEEGGGDYHLMEEEGGLDVVEVEAFEIGGEVAVMYPNPLLSTAGLTAHDRWVTRQVEQFSAAQTFLLETWDGAAVWIELYSYWYPGRVVEYEGIYMGNVPQWYRDVTPNWEANPHLIPTVTVGYDYYNSKGIIQYAQTSDTTTEFNPYGGFPRVVLQTDWNPLPSQRGYWRPGYSPYLEFFLPARDLIGGIQIKHSIHTDGVWKSLIDTHTYLSKPTEVQLEFAAYEYLYVGQNDSFACRWKGRSSTDIPNFDNLRDAINQERDFRESQPLVEDQPQDEQTALYTQLIETLQAQVNDITDNYDLWERIDYAIVVATVNDTDWLQLLVDEATRYLKSKEPDLASEILNEAHGEELQAWQAKAAEELEWVPVGSLLYFDLANVPFMGWADRQAIKDAIKRGKAYKPKKKKRARRYPRGRR